MLAKVKNWSDFQHYKDRSPPWIKLHRELLNDFEFACLPIASKALAPLLWLLAAESNDGAIRIDIDFLAFRLRWSEQDVRSGLTPLIEKGFLIVASDVLATCLQHAIPETEVEAEVEREVETESVTPNGVTCPNSSDAPPPKTEGCPAQRIVDLYHEKLPELPRCEKLTQTRRGYLQQRWREDLETLDDWTAFFADVRKSDFLMGKKPGRDGRPPFRADLEWLTKPANYAKLIEGKYHRAA